MKASDSTAKPKLLAVDDDEQILKQVEWALSDEFRIFTAGDRKSAISTFNNENISVALLDLGLPPHPREATEGLAALEDMLAANPLAKIIIVSGNSERENALLAVAKGAHDIFPKPVDLDELKVVLNRVYKRVQLEKESLEERALARRVSFEDIIGSSEPMKRVFSLVRKVSESDYPVLIMGESGTGKELIANTIHNLSARQAGPFTAINCAAIPETLLESELFGHEKGAFTGASAQKKGRLESAQGGTLFLDEIGELAQELQVKILRFLQEKVIERVGGRHTIEVDSRIIAATHKDLAAEVKENRFREDLYFRLAVLKIELPPLRERGSDVIDLAEHLLFAFSREMGRPPKKFSKPALEAMRVQAWPGNVRELQNRVKRALVLADGPFIGPRELELEEPEMQAQPQTLKEAKEVMEKELIRKALEEHGGNITQAAKALGISRPTLYDLISRYSL